MDDDLNDVKVAKELALYRIKVAKEDLESAIKNLENEDYRTANNRAYYAIYHAISACLALKRKAYRSHRQSVGMFNKEFVHTGIFPKEYGRMIKEAQDVRHSSDYDDFYIVSVKNTNTQVSNAGIVVCAIEEYINSQI